MPIKVTCQCGKSFAAKDELAGKAVRCPNCKQPLRIPGGATAPVAAAAAPAKTAPKAAAARPASASSSSGIGIGDEVHSHSLDDSFLSGAGLHQQALNTRPCPGCTAPLAPEAVICIKCGFNTKLGRRMETIKVGSGGGPEGHGAVAQDLLDRAAESIEEQKEEDRKKTAEGVPIWVYAIGLAAVIGFCLMMSFIPQGVGMLIAGLVVIVLSFLVDFYAWLRGLIAAFMQNPLIGLGIFFGDIAIIAGMVVLARLEIPYVSMVAQWLALPILWTIFVFANWETCGIYWTMLWFGIFLRWIGLGMLLLGAMMAMPNQNQGAAAPPPPPPVAVVSLDGPLPATQAVEYSVLEGKADSHANETLAERCGPVFVALHLPLDGCRRSDGPFALSG
jgi:hypothetical protein